VDFAPVGEQQVGLLQYLENRLDHVSYEWVCSGRGLPNVYAYLKDSGYANEPSWLAERLAESSDPNPVIVDAALDPARRCDLCVATLDLFVSILGAEAGNMALKVLSTGGVYIGGGIPTHILPALQNGRFMRAFLHKGRFADLLRNVPVHVILNRQVALFGAACHGLDLV
jgi:glucokinase